MDLSNFNSKEIAKAIELENNKIARKKLQAFLLLKEGKTVVYVSKTFSVCTNTVYSWVKQIKREGLENLQIKKGRGRKYLLPLEKLEELKLVLSKPIKTEDGYTRGWQSKDVIQHIKKEYKVTYSFSRIRELLNLLDFHKIVCRPRNKRRNNSLTKEFVENTKKNEICWVKNTY